MWWLLLLPFSLFAVTESDSMLFQAESFSKLYAPLIAKQPPPSASPRTDDLLRRSANWLIVDLADLRTKESSLLSSLSKESLWECLSLIGFDGVELKGLKTPISLQIDPKYGTDQDYGKLVSNAMKKEMHFIGSLVGSTTGKGIDFALALKNIGSYPGLYSLIEIPEKDWGMLPEIPRSALGANIPWLMLQKLKEKGYVPEEFEPYVKLSHWNATECIRCADGAMLRWIYLHDDKGHPKLNWLSPTFASERLAAGDAIHSIYNLCQPILQIDADIPPNARETLSLTVRKLKGYTAARCKGGIDSFTNQTSDLLYDHLTPMSAVHALIASDAEVLRLTYRLLLDAKVQPKRLIHALEPFKQAPCNFEKLTEEELRTRLLRGDKDRLAGLTSSLSWITACYNCVPDLHKKREQAGFCVTCSLSLISG